MWHRADQELMFFEHTKCAFKVRDVYDDFSKLLNMYTHNIMGRKTLVVRAEKFLADDAPPAR
jgi:histone deacetylase complex regulatory component SIN3